ncbi:MAG TPA: bifunctional hydroxymethylpyrimidine kinase/phosphomethylpyrimidine kinase [Gemmatimonadaceae bacterium]|nr:bifunctional hydroxymethylpyrimidine kinase/phosphomethylpyrimidine kinase [Gemmatimonadaceae bacterium]
MAERAKPDGAGHYVNVGGTTSREIALTIAGSDSGGGAGLQADLKTFQRFGVFGTTVVTAITAQNTVNVTTWEAVRPELVRAQIDALVADLRPAALKSGMLGTTAIVETVARALAEHGLRPYTLDPVMVATSGDPLVAPDTIDAIRKLLVPVAALVTPNLDEAGILVGRPVRDVPAMESAAREIVERLGAGAALVKGGHLGADGRAAGELTDVLFLDGRIHRFSHAFLDSRSTHGTGCTVSSAITAQLALGVPMLSAVEVALDYVHEAIRTAPGLGAGHGPLNHNGRIGERARERENG